MKTMELTSFTALSFDCYGTLIDWDTGISAILLPGATAWS
jgi:putative hydrolase of the HAD superfamily